MKQVSYGYIITPKYPTFASFQKDTHKVNRNGTTNVIGNHNGTLR